jgi:hypothetical protein
MIGGITGILNGPSGESFKKQIYPYLSELARFKSLDAETLNGTLWVGADKDCGICMERLDVPEAECFTVSEVVEAVGACLAWLVANRECGVSA